MSYPVTYYCPRCESLHELDREGYLADKTVTPYPLEGWSYADPDEDFEADDVDGVRIVCGDDDLLVTGEKQPVDDPGCGDPFYLSFVRFEDGREVEPEPERESVELALGDRPKGPRGPTQGPGDPGGPTGR